MGEATPSPAGQGLPPRPRKPRLFGDLRVRPKLIVLHNLFFLVLSCSVYFSLIPFIEEEVQTSSSHEEDLVRRVFADGSPLPAGLASVDWNQGSADTLNLAPDTRLWLDRNPGAVLERPEDPGLLYRKDPSTGLYQRLSLASDFHDARARRAKITLFVTLGLVYVLAVVLLEVVIMPRYVYRPIQMTLAADRATREGDREQELIAESKILGDEIGDIMRSRNQTVAKLRLNEAELERALAQLAELAADLQRKNDMLETAKRNMAAQDRLVSLGLLSASVAHELNTPLAVLHGSIEKLLETVPNPAAQERLSRMLRVAERLRRISIGLLDFSRARRDEDQREPVALRSLIQEAWSLVAIDGKAAAAFFSNQVASQHCVTGDPDRLMQVFVNLLRNALHAIQGSGHIVVHSRLARADGRDWVVIAVDDDGAGIPDDVLPNLFEAFVTSRLDSKGTGLGLTVASGIVERHGGTIRAANRAGGGARLEVTLPADPPAVSEIARNQAREGRPVPPRRR